jgi:hypothetical protein
MLPISLYEMEGANIFVNISSAQKRAVLARGTRVLLA